MKINRFDSITFAFLVLLASCISGNAQIVQLAKLTPLNGTPGDRFGTSVAISGNTAVVGADFKTVGANIGQGAAYVFVYDGTSWNQIAELTASDGKSNQFFGTSVAIVGNPIAVIPSYGNGYLFVEPPNGWTNATQTAELALPSGGGGGYYNSGVAISEDQTLVVVGGGNVGASYVFEKPAGGWTNMQPTAGLFGSCGGDDFSVAISGRIVVVGMVPENNQIPGSACVYQLVHGRSQIPSSAILRSTGASTDFGWSVSIHDNTIAVGDPFQADSGAVDIFIKPATGWNGTLNQSAVLGLPVSTPVALGNSVVLAGNVLVAGAPGDFIGQSEQGAVFAYAKPDDGWANTSLPNLARTALDGMPHDAFGLSVGLSGRTAIVGAPFLTMNGNPTPGAAYIFGPTE